MLVLSRKKDEEIVITCPDGTKITVCVVDIRGDKARLGFFAPPEIVIDRKEIADRKLANAHAAAALLDEK